MDLFKLILRWGIKIRKPSIEFLAKNASHPVRKLSKFNQNFLRNWKIPRHEQTIWNRDFQNKIIKNFDFTVYTLRGLFTFELLNWMCINMDVEKVSVVLALIWKNYSANHMFRSVRTTKVRKALLLVATNTYKISSNFVYMCIFLLFWIVFVYFRYFFLSHEIRTYFFWSFLICMHMQMQNTLKFTINENKGKSIRNKKCSKQNACHLYSVRTIASRASTGTLYYV